jgi:hypothetical protein
MTKAELLESVVEDSGVTSIDAQRVRIGFLTEGSGTSRSA